MKRTATPFFSAAVSMVAAIALTACTVAGTAKPAIDGGTPVSVPTSTVAATPTVDQAAARSALIASVASSQSAADKAAADQAAADQAAAEKSSSASAAAQAAGQSAAEKAAADQAAAEQAAAEQSAAEQSAADEAAAEQSAAEQAAADEADAAANGWYTPSGNWVSPDTAARALAAGISPGETVPDYLRCGTICGEGPTSGEVQAAFACQDGTMTADECAGIDVDAIIKATTS